MPDTPENLPTPAEATAEPVTEPANPAESLEAEAAEVEDLTTVELEQLLDEYSPQAAPATGEVRHATVVKFTEDGVVVDLGLKSEGLVPLAEFTDEQGNPTIQPGDFVEVLLEGGTTNEGYIPCSSEGAHRLKLWDEVERAYREKEKVRCKVVERAKGGYEVEINLSGAHPGRRPLSAFLPGSQVDLRPVRNWEGFIGKEIPCRVLKLNRRRGRVVVSRRTLLEEEQALRQKLFDEVLKPGAVVMGRVKNLTDYGAFIDLGGIDGLLHITDISYRRLGHPSDALQPEDEVRVQVLKIDKEKQRISLGMKQLEPDPWVDAAKKYPIGQRVRGRVTHLVDYGAFVELEPGVEGLIHVSEMSWTRRVKHPSDILKPEDWVEAVVLDVQPGEKRISLGLRQTQADPFERVPQRYPVGRDVRGRVRTLTDFGAFIEVEPGIEGLVHHSELSWDRGVKKPAQVLKRGQEVTAKVLKVDVQNRRLSLSIKAVTPDPWATFATHLQPGAVVKGKILRRTDFGAFVELAPGVEGLCHVTELPSDADEAVKNGEEYEFRVLKVSPNERRISLSLRSELDRKAAQQYGGQGRGTATLEEILTAKLQHPGTEKS
ncbi:MAG TPA: 30S ribosomal protein S1 [Candidatus Xenobia bacterium]|nr:30S ribosomal protein S1 [Candidatus Xenobia bacterium]